MIVRIGGHWSIAAMLWAFLVLSSPTFVFRPAYRPFLRDWKVVASVAIVNPADLSLSGESVRAQKTMDHEPTQLYLRAFRVVGRYDGIYHKWLIIEDTARAQFRFVGYSASGYQPTNDMKATIDRKDAWNVLNSFREAARLVETGSSPPQTADSIDDAIAQQQTEWQERKKYFSSQAMTLPNERLEVDTGRSRSVPNRDGPTGAGKGAKPTISMIRGPELSEAERQQMTDEVWHFAGVVHLEWRVVPRTPAGYECEVLTFDGLEKVLVHPTFVEIPSKSK